MPLVETIEFKHETYEYLFIFDETKIKTQAEKKNMRNCPSALSLRAIQNT